MSAKTTTSEQNLATMRQFITEVQEGGNTSCIEKFVHPDFHDHPTEGPPLPPGSGYAQTQDMVRALHNAFSNIKVTIIQSIGTGDVVATNKIISGMQVDSFFGRPANGEKVEFRVMDFVRFEDGLFREHWANVGPLVVIKPTGPD